MLMTKAYDRSLPFHPVTKEYASFTPEEYADLLADIKRHGVRVQILVWREQIVDGRHRHRASRELGIVPDYRDISYLTEAQMRDYVASLNHKRRSRTKPLTSEEKRKLVEAELKTDPARSNVAIADGIGVHHKTVATLRKELEEKGVAKSATPSERKSVNGKLGEGQRKVTVEAATIDTPPKPASTAVEISNRPYDQAKIKAIKRELSADHRRSNIEIAKLTNTGRGLVSKVRAAEGYLPFSEKLKTAEHKAVQVPEGKLLSDIYREVMALEDDGMSQEEAAKRLGVGAENYRTGRNIIRLAENSRLDAKDREAANSALALMDKHRRPSEAFDVVRDIADRLWGTRGGLRNSKQARKLLDRYMQSTLVIAELAEQVLAAEVPYLNTSELAAVRANLNRAVSRVRDAIKKLEGVE